MHLATRVRDFDAVYITCSNSIKYIPCLSLSYDLLFPPPPDGHCSDLQLWSERIGGGMFILMSPLCSFHSRWFRYVHLLVFVNRWIDPFIAWTHGITNWRCLCSVLMHSSLSLVTRFLVIVHRVASRISNNAILFCAIWVFSNFLAIHREWTPRWYIENEYALMFSWICYWRNHCNSIRPSSWL